MRHHEVIHLISLTMIEDDLGNQIEVPSERQVFANEHTVSITEYYNAATNGLRASKAFEVYTFEYEDESRFKHNDIVYRIIRVAPRGEKTVLTGEKVAADG